jgi:PD-(D/E)XK nuclease superfamily protein
MRWSYSTHKLMRQCQRQLVFSYLVASPRARDPARREAYVLRQLRSLPAWRGSLIHKVLAGEFLDGIRARRPIDAKVLTARVSDLAKRQLAFSSARRYRLPSVTKTSAGEEYCALFEHEHGREVSSEVLNITVDSAAQCFHYLAGQTEFLDNLYAGSDYTAEVPLSFALDGAIVRAVPDLVFMRHKGQPTIVDWKIGTSETADYSRQMSINALTVLRSMRWPNTRPDALVVYEVDLQKRQVQQHPVSGARLNETEDFIYRSILQLRALTDHWTGQSVDLDEFDVASHPQTCAHCPFSGLCVAQLRDAGRIEEVFVVQERLL